MAASATLVAAALVASACDSDACASRYPYGPGGTDQNNPPNAPAKPDVEH